MAFSRKGAAGSSVPWRVPRGWFRSRGHKPCWLRPSCPRRSPISTMGCSVPGKRSRSVSAAWRSAGGDRRPVEVLRIWLAWLANTRICKRRLEEALRMAEQISYTAGMAKGQLVLGTIALHAGEHQAAIQYVFRASRCGANWRARLTSQPHSIGLGQHCWKSTNTLAAQTGIPRNAGISINRWATGVASPLAIHNLGDTAYDLGDYARARELLCDALRIRHHLGLQRGYAYSFEFLAEVDESEKRYERAVQLLAAAETLRVRIGAPLEQINQKENDGCLDETTRSAWRCRV